MRRGTCEYCGKINELFNGLCKDCYTEDNQILLKVKKVLSENPYANAMEIATQENIPIEKITRLIKFGKLSIGTEKKKPI